VVKSGSPAEVAGFQTKDEFFRLMESRLKIDGNGRTDHGEPRRGVKLLLSEDHFEAARCSRKELAPIFL
jgi:hypothetical protein